MEGRQRTETILKNQTLNYMAAQEMPAYFTDYYDYMISCSPRTRKQYVYEAFELYRFALDECLAPEDLPVPEVITKYVKLSSLSRFLKRNNANSGTYNTRRARIASFYQFMIENNDATKNQALSLKVATIDSDPKQPLSWTELDSIKHYLYHPDEMRWLGYVPRRKYIQCKNMYIFAIELMLSHGVRAAGIAEMTLEDIDFEQNVIRIHKKGGKVQRLIIGDKLMAILKDWLKDRKEILLSKKQNHNFVIFAPTSGKPITSDQLSTLIEPFSFKLDRKVTPHDFRRTFGRHLYDISGHNIVTVQKALGHRNVATTQQYIGIGNEEVDEMILDLEEMSIGLKPRKSRRRK